MTTITDQFAPVNTPVATAEAIAPALASKHSRFGLASFAISLLAGATEFLGVALSGIIAVANGGLVDPASPIAMIVGLVICGGIPVALLGAGLGIVGLLERDRRKPFAVLGLILSLATVLGVGLLMWVGTQAMAAGAP